ARPAASTDRTPQPPSRPAAALSPFVTNQRSREGGLIHVSATGTSPLRQQGPKTDRGEKMCPDKDKNGSKECTGCGGDCEKNIPGECRGPSPVPWLTDDRTQYFY